MEKINVRYADENGKVREELFEAKSVEELSNSLKQKGCFVLSINRSTALNKAMSIFDTKGKTTVKELNEFTKMLRTLIKSGMPVNDAIDILLDGAEDTRLNQALRIVSEDIRTGTSFSKALARHTDIFPNIYVKTVVAGEKSGAMEPILKRLVEFFTRSIAIRKKFTGALIYPAILLCVALIATCYLMVAVVPKFQDLFSSMGAELPMPTQILLAISGFLSDWFLILFIIFVAVAFSFYAWATSTEGKLAIDRIKLKLPILSTLESSFAFSQFSRTMATMLSGGIPFYESLKVVVDTIENSEIAGRMGLISDELERGKSFSKTLKEIPGVPYIMVRLAAVGEESGNMTEMLDNLADHFDEEITELTDKVTALIEPALFIGMAIIIGFVIIALLYPVFTVASQIN